MLPWSGENLAFVDEVQPGETSRPRRDKVLVCAKRKGLSRLEVFSTRVLDFEVGSHAAPLLWPNTCVTFNVTFRGVGHVREDGMELAFIGALEIYCDIQTTRCYRFR